MGSQALKAPRGQFFMLDPDRVVLVTDPKHPLYDKRVERPLTEQFIRNVDKFGVKEPLKGRKNGKLDDGEDRVETVAGRRRLRAARIVNTRRREEGRDPLLVPVILERGSDAEMDLFMVLENENREDDDLVTKAEKAKRLIDQHGEENTALAFGKTVETIRSWLKLLDLEDGVKEKVRRGELTVAAALPLVDLSRDEQKIVVENLTPTGATAKATRKAAARGKKADVLKAADEVAAARKELLNVAFAYATEGAKLDTLKGCAVAYGECLARSKELRSKKK